MVLNELSLGLSLGDRKSTIKTLAQLLEYVSLLRKWDKRLGDMKHMKMI